MLGNGVDFAALPGAPGAPAERNDGPLHLACVGAVTAHKGVHVLLEALRLARLPRTRLTLVGEINPGYFRSVTSAAERVPELDFRAYGRFAPHELPFLLADVDAVIIPSLVWETYSIVARESFACGVPVLASRIGALPEAVRDGENGLLFPPGDAVDLGALLQMLDRGRLTQLRAGIQPSDWISVSERTAHLVQILSQVTAGERPLEPASALAELQILRQPFLESR